MLVPGRTSLITLAVAVAAAAAPATALAGSKSGSKGCDGGKNNTARSDHAVSGGGTGHRIR